VGYFGFHPFTGVCEFKSACKLENIENIGLREASTWLAIKNAVKYFRLPSFRGVCDLKSAPKVKKRKCWDA